MALGRREGGSGFDECEVGGADGRIESGFDTGEVGDERGEVEVMGSEFRFENREEMSGRGGGEEDVPVCSREEIRVCEDEVTRGLREFGVAEVEER